MKNETSDIVIIGGGIQGCSIAWHLQSAGINCTVLEKDYVGRHASGSNAGGLRRLGRHLDEVPLSVRSSEIWQELEHHLNADIGFHSSRQIKVAENEADMEKLRLRAESVKNRGFNHEVMIDKQQMRDFLPAVASHCVGGLLVEGDGSAIPYKATSAFARAAKAQGTSFHEGSPVTSIIRCGSSWKVKTSSQTFQCGTVINCAGAWGDKIANMVGDKLPLEPVALMLMISQRMPPFLNAVVGTASRALSFKQFDNGTVLIGGAHRGFVNRDMNKATIRIQGLAHSSATACDIFPIMEKAKIVRSWAGIEGFSPDQIPILGHGSQQGIIHAFAFSAHGFQLSPVIGEVVRDLVQTGKSKLPIDAFNPMRFIV